MATYEHKKSWRSRRGAINWNMIQMMRKRLMMNWGARWRVVTKSGKLKKLITLKLTTGTSKIDIRRDPQDMGHLPIPSYPHRPTRTSITVAISAMVKLFCRGFFFSEFTNGVTISSYTRRAGFEARNRCASGLRWVLSTQFRYVSKK